MFRILIIDDDEGIREHATAILMMAGHEVYQAADGEHGLARAREVSPDLILCDVSMPGLDGYEVLEKIRQCDALEQTPFIFLTANSSEQDMRDGMNLGAEDYLTKPVSMANLTSAVNARLELAKKRAIKRNQEIENIRTQIASHLPHEFLTPLNGILGISSMIEDDPDNFSGNELREMGTLIRQSGERLLSTVHRFILYSELRILLGQEAGSRKFSAQATYNLAQYTREHAWNIATQWNRTDDLNLELEDGPCRIVPRYLEHLVSQLVDNAFKFSMAGAPVDVTLRFDTDSAILTTHDKGRGMSPDQIQNINGFTQFQRKEFEQQGSGLGLTIVKMITELYGGSLDIASDAQTGTVVTVTLPTYGNPETR